MSRKPITSSTKSESKTTLVPKLRFPQFRGKEGWEQAVLATACEMQAGKFVPAANIAERNEYGMYRCYGGNGLRGYTHTYTHDGTYPLIGRQGALCGNAHLVQGRFHATEHAIVATPRSNIDVRWLYYSIDLLNLNRFATGQAQPGLSVDALNNVALAIPKQESEQHRIASCLSSLDSLISAQARKVDALKRYKKGLMQQLFPREGETQPRLRFPEFRGQGEWEEKTLGCIASFSSGGTPAKDNPDYWDGTIPWVSASSMYDLIVEKADHYVTPQAIGNGTRIAKKGSILILVRGSMLFKRVPICIAGIDVAFNQDVKAIDVDASINKTFLLFQLSAFQSRFPINETGIGAGKIELDHLVGFRLYFPRPAEQQRIASFLSSLDEQITAETHKLEALKTHKKGLMQQLFPTPEEVGA
ncbi:MAG: restriction endonuclease subunit S [Candidatus Kapabacteria bacterium]|nr:restriction endonuclease subunit S [Candidatus Kapabacteria bacterium]